MITLNIYKSDIEKTRTMSRLRVFDSPILAPYLNLIIISLSNHINIYLPLSYVKKVSLIIS